MQNLIWLDFIQSGQVQLYLVDYCLIIHFHHEAIFQNQNLNQWEIMQFPKELQKFQFMYLKKLFMNHLAGAILMLLRLLKNNN